MVVTGNHKADDISIHVPRVGDDVPEDLSHHPGLGISIHAPRVGGDSKNSQNFKLLL